MNPIERMLWVKRLLEEKSGGAFELVAGNLRGDLFLRCSDKANVGLYLSVLPNMKTGRYDCKFQGYTRCSGGYLGAAGMQRLADEYQMVATLVKDLESAKISLTEDELYAFVAEMKSTEEQIENQPQAPQMGM